MSAVPAAPPKPPKPADGGGLARVSHATSWGPGFFVKLILVALVDASAVYVIWTAATQHSWLIAAVSALVLVVVTVVYFSKRMLPAKYLVPGLAFLLIYQIFAILFTGYTALTNYGDGHNSTQADAVSAILAGSEVRVPDSAAYPLSVVRADNGTLGFAVVDPKTGQAEYGDAATPLAPVDGATVTDGKVTALPGHQVLKLADLLQIQQQVVNLRVPMSTDPKAGSLHSQDGSTGYVFSPTISYDEAQGTMTDTATGTVYTADSRTGYFVAPDGTHLQQGWKVFVGLSNFGDVLTAPELRGPFLSVLVWTFAFAFLSVLLCFALGLFLAIVFNTEKMRSKRLYRSLLIIPYALPGFLATVVWHNLLNKDFGFLNQVVLGGVHIDWLGDPWLAKLSVILVNLWMGYPYMFLVATGALQSLPTDVVEAARVDGAGIWRTFRSVKLPLLMVSLAPLLISSFAFNFNNFNVIYQVTKGGPSSVDINNQAGATDILISFVYKLAFDGPNAQYGLASAISIMIFILVGVISFISFRQTRSLEELN